MTNAPEQIWATGNKTTGSWNHKPLNARIAPEQTEYVRADLKFPQWKPKETAPKTGKEVLLKTRWGHLHLAYWSDEAHIGQGTVMPAWQTSYCDDDPYYSVAVEDKYVIAWANVHPN